MYYYSLSSSVKYNNHHHHSRISSTPYEHNNNNNNNNNLKRNHRCSFSNRNRIVSLSSSSSSSSAYDTSDSNNLGNSSSNNEVVINVGIGKSIVKRIQLALDGNARFALAGNRTAEVDVRPISDILYGFVFALVTLTLLGIADVFVNGQFQQPFFIGAWGTISVLAFGATDAPALRMWNVVIATMFASATAIFFVQNFGTTPFTRALAVSTSIAFMMWTGSIHPPGGAACVIAMDFLKFSDLGWLYVIYPTVLGSVFICMSGALCSRVKKKFPFTVEDVKNKLNAKDMARTLKKCGQGGILAYGIMNTLWYSFGIIAGLYAIICVTNSTTIMAIKPKLLPALAAVWAGSQATKLLRVSSSIALAPLCDRLLDKINSSQMTPSCFKQSKGSLLFWSCMFTVLIGLSVIAVAAVAFLAKANLFVVRAS